jgi:SAM-dependent methyltransferase
LFAEPSAALAEWRNRLGRTLRQVEADAAKSASAVKRPGLNALTRQRLERLATAQTHHVAELVELMAPLEIERTAPLATQLALRTRINPAQGLTTYYSNLHRDWCWGDAENDASFELVAAALPPLSGKRLLILGSGGGRLAYDLHTRLTPAVTVALDLNPLLTFAAQRIAHGARLTLHEFPLAPCGLDDVAIERHLCAPAPVGAGFHCLLADALRAPFASEAYDAIVTPWFVDIVDEDLNVLARRINRLLRNDGTWVVFGSLRFASPDPAACYALEEVVELVRDAGFAPGSATDVEIPYMCSPASRHARRERVVTLAAAKVKRIAAPDRHVALPDWLVQSNKPVPLLEAFRLQSATTQIYAFIMSMIDGRRTLKEMAELMEQRRLMPRADAEYALRDFLTKMYDESRAHGGV